MDLKIQTNQIQDDLAVNWHPFMQMKDFETYPPKRIIRAKGLKLFSEDSWYYDTISSWWCNILGHCHPKITKALQEQIETLDHIMFGNFTHDPAIELSKKFNAPKEVIMGDVINMLQELSDKGFIEE